MQVVIIYLLFLFPKVQPVPKKEKKMNLSGSSDLKDFDEIVLSHNEYRI